MINSSTLSEPVLGMMPQILPLPEINFAELTADQLWSIFETKAFFGGALAYAVFSRASKLGCPCSVTLEKTREGRKINQMNGELGALGTAIYFGPKK